MPNIQSIPNLNMAQSMMPMMAPTNLQAGPLISPLISGQMQQQEDQQIELEELREKVKMLEEELENEVGNNKLLEEKCEEYLGQLQRSADIIESTKGKQSLQVAEYEEKVASLRDLWEEERIKNEDLILDNQKLRDDLTNFKLAQQGDQTALSKLQDQLEEANQTMAEMRKQVE